MFRKTYTFDDVSIVPKYSKLESREDVSLGIRLGRVWLDIPIISSPMDTVTDGSMAAFMTKCGGMGIVHRYMDIATQVEEVKWVISHIDSNLLDIQSEAYPVAAAVGVNGDSWERTQALFEAGCKIICLDVAHGHSQAVLERTEKIASEYPDVTLISANIATAAAAADTANSGADILRVGVGAGSACTTRLVAGCGVPQITAIQDCLEGLDASDTPKEVSVISDGGIKHSGDAIKALAAGADAVMMGGFFAPFPVSAGPTVYQNLDEATNWGRLMDTFVVQKGLSAEEVFESGFPEIEDKRRIKKKLYRGMASDSALSQYKGNSKYIVEGASFLIDIDYDFENTMQRFVDGLRLGLSYVGAADIREFQIFSEMIEITDSGKIEAIPHMGIRGGEPQ